MIAKPVSVEALPDYSIFIAFNDNIQGKVSLKHLAHKGVFRAWDSNDLFKQVYIDDFGAIVWNDDIDICPDNIYLKLKNAAN